MKFKHSDTIASNEIRIASNVDISAPPLKRENNGENEEQHSSETIALYCPAATENLYTSEKKKEVLYPSWYRKDK